MAPAAGSGGKQPYLMRRPDHGPFAFAGLWESWMGSDGSEIDSACIITTEANRLLAPIHDRMPVILGPADFEAWLDVRNNPPGSVDDLLRPADDDLLEAFPVSTRVNKADNDDPACWNRSNRRCFDGRAAIDRSGGSRLDGGVLAGLAKDGDEFRNGNAAILALERFFALALFLRSERSSVDRALRCHHCSTLVWCRAAKRRRMDTLISPVCGGIMKTWSMNRFRGPRCDRRH